jgi:predicted phosphate transport protein (TIGR00153 family)
MTFGNILNFILIGRCDNMFNLNPKEDKFYKMLNEAAEIVVEAAKILRKSLDSLSNIDLDVSRIEELEHQGDRIVNTVVKELNDSFITPFDREDIYLLIKRIDDVLDLINSTVHRFVMFNMKESTEASKLLADMIIKCTNHVMELMGELHLISSKNHINEKIITINQIESAADRIFRQTVGDLFRNEKDPIEIIKWKEIYQILENTIDKCEKIANIVEGVVIKNA